MPPDAPHTVTLTCHPETPSDAVRAIAARVSRARGASLAVSYVLDGDLDRVRVPASRGSGPLWQHTCCEIFIGCKGTPAYYEYNLSPSGEWAAYAFDGYRRPRAGEWQPEAPAVAVRGAAGRLELDAVISLDRLPALPPGSPLSLALSAVIEDRDGALSYWALKHPAGRPDFHHSEAFALELAAPTTPPARAGTPSGQPPEAAGARRLEDAQASSFETPPRPRAGGEG